MPVGKVPANKVAAVQQVVDQQAAAILPGFEHTEAKVAPKLQSAAMPTFKATHGLQLSINVSAGQQPVVKTAAVQQPVAKTAAVQQLVVKTAAVQQPVAKTAAVQQPVVKTAAFQQLAEDQHGEIGVCIVEQAPQKVRI